MTYKPALLIQKQAKTMQETLLDWVNHNTHHANLHGLHRFAKLLCSAFEGIADTVDIVDLPLITTLNAKAYPQTQTLGPAIVASKRPEAPVQWYIGGHYDTVFPGDSAFQQANWLASDVIGGPGVLDMKAGILVMLAALKAFESSPHASQIGWRVVLNPDEEIGSPASSGLIEAQAKACALGFIFEPALDSEGTWAGARGGSARYTLMVRGQAAHVGRNFHEGRNAIVQCALWIQKLAALNHDFPQCAINVGVIRGGEAVNQVPDLAVAYVDVRAPTPRDLAAIEAAMASVLVNQDSDYALTWQRTQGRTPKLLAGTQQQLLDWSQMYLASHHIKVSWRDTGGCCDGNNLSALGVPNIDTLGACGGLIHTTQEWLAVPSMVDKAIEAAWLWHGLAAHDSFRLPSCSA